jgi:RNA polymerase sigma factor (sigma-70 family)
MAIADVNRPYGKVSKGHRLPYGTLADASYELRQAYYANGYLHDKDMPELPCPPRDYQEWVDPEEELSKKEMVAVVEEMLDTLSPRLKKVLCLRFGIGLTQDYTLEEVGTRLDVTRERIRQIEAKALRLMKKPSRADVLRQLLGVYESTAEKEAGAKKLQEQWRRARERARQRDEEQKKAEIAQIRWAQEQKAAQKRQAQELERVYQQDKQLREKWEEIKPMVSDTDWVEHLKTANPEMYKELKYMVGDIWGKNAKQVWEMYAKEK